ncbi:hypothetical protein IJ818_06630 [bacterium]|nr:hypothetical protein [bacterium]
MPNKLRLNFTHKLNIKGVFDTLFFLFSGAIVCAFAYLEKASLINLFMLLTVLTILYAIQYYMTKTWIEKAISSIIYRQINSTSDKTNSILNLINNQKNIASKHLTETTNYAATVENMKNISAKTHEVLKSLNDKAQSTLAYSNKEKESMSVTSDKMFNLKQKMQIVAEMVLDLSNTLQQIKNNLSVVEDINEQTNMLALNASVEAARAGEHGKGFAIVASEIRKLSEESKEATNKITNMLTDIQNSASTSVLATEESNKEVDIVLKSSKDTVNTLNEMTQLVNEISKPIEQINSYADNQSSYSSQIHSSLNEISNWLNVFLDTIDKSVVEINSLNNMSTNLKENIFDE